jgi:outer membrane protein TolC
MVCGLSVGLYSGCSLAPAGTKAEMHRADIAGRVYSQPREKRVTPDLPSNPTWEDVLQRAMLVNGDVEAAYWEWRAALERVHMAGAYPNSNVQIGYEYMFSKENLKAWNRTTISAGFDPSMTLRLPQKVQQAAKAALAQAQAAGLRFQNAKFTLQRKVLTAYWDYALAAEKVRIRRDNVSLLEMLVNQASDRVKTGAPQQDLLKAQMQHRLARNELANMESELSRMRAMLNGMLARPADAPLSPPAQLPSPRAVPADDAALIAAAVDRNPELAALAADVRGRSDALKLAKMAYIPDVQPAFSITGNVSQALGAMVMLPTAIPMIEGQIKEARAMLSSAQAMESQTRSDRAASFVAALYAMRNAERADQLLSKTILPLAQQVLSSSRQAYSAGQITYVELVDSERALLDVREIIAEMRTERERRLVEIEALAGVDIETFAAPAASQLAATLPSTPTTHPAPPRSMEADHAK